jgi:Flp pilus assembly protein TadD
VSHIKSRLPTPEEIEKMIEEEIMASGIVDSVKVEPRDPSIRGKYSTRLKIDEKLDDYVSIRAKVRQYVYEELTNMLIEISSKYDHSKYADLTFDDYVEHIKEWK